MDVADADAAVVDFGADAVVVVVAVAVVHAAAVVVVVVVVVHAVEIVFAFAASAFATEADTAVAAAADYDDVRNLPIDSTHFQASKSNLIPISRHRRSSPRCKSSGEIQGNSASC